MSQFTYEDLQFIRAFKTLLDNMISKKQSASLTKTEIDNAFDAVMKVLRKHERQALPNLTIPTLVEIICEDGNKYNVNKSSKIIFEHAQDGEWVAIGTLLDGNQVLKLTIQDLITCANNNWRFKASKCLLAQNLCMNSPYAIID